VVPPSVAGAAARWPENLSTFVSSAPTRLSNIMLNSKARPPSCALPSLLGASLGLSLCAADVRAQGVAMEQQLQTVQVTGARSPLDPNLPNSTVSKTAEQLREQIVFNPEDAFAKFPSLTVRKRYLGDRNANVGGRSYGVLQPGRTLVYLDGYLISNFLGRFDAPRWNMVNTEAIERIDALYGPFSAIYPGNSIGTTLVITERKPAKLEASASLKLNHQAFDEYATREGYNSSQLSVRVANRLDSGLWFVLGLQQQDSQGHPMGYANAVRGVAAAASNFQPPSSGTPVTGILYDQDPLGRERAVFGATGIDHTRQTTLNARVGYLLSPTQEIEARLALWRNDSTVSTQTALRDAAGNPVWSGSVNDGRYRFTVAANAFAPSQRDERNRQLGLTWRTRHASGWNASVVATQYRLVSDANRQANLAQPLAEAGGPGTVTRRDGTGWDTLELQTTYKPTDGDFGGGRHALTFGVHRNHYQLNNVVNSASDWRTTETALDQRYTGDTAITALYAQDAWRLAPDWMLTAGLRWEQFESSDGSQFFAGPPLAETRYADRRLSATSPKLSLAWAVQESLLLKASLGRGVRFPNVDELFNGTKTGSSITVSDPNLKPEKSDAAELAAELDFTHHWLRASLFRDDVRDTILRQTDNTVTPNVTRVSNVDRVLAQGLELVWQARDVGLKGLNLGGSATWTDAVVKRNRANLAQEGKNWLRIPKQRYTAEVSYRPDAQWLFAAAWRWTGRQYNTELNTDINPDTFGGISSVNQLDLKAAWRFAPGWEGSLGLNNVGNNKSWQAHTLPQRSVQAELRYALP
jgi:iron complex outermembrane receptor protein